MGPYGVLGLPGASWGIWAQLGPYGAKRGHMASWGFMESPGASWGVDRLTGRLYWHYRHSTGDDDDDDDDDDALGGSGPLWSTSVGP